MTTAPFHNAASDAGALPRSRSKPAGQELAAVPDDEAEAEGKRAPAGGCRSGQKRRGRAPPTSQTSNACSSPLFSEIGFPFPGNWRKIGLYFSLPMILVNFGLKQPAGTVYRGGGPRRAAITKTGSSKGRPSP